MTEGRRITLHIDRLRVSGASGAEAAAMTSALRDALAAGLAADPGALTARSVDSLRLTLPRGPAQGPAAVGAAAGQSIAGALTAPKGGR